MNSQIVIYSVKTSQDDEGRVLVVSYGIDGQNRVMRTRDTNSSLLTQIAKREMQRV